MVRAITWYSQALTATAFVSEAVTNIYTELLKILHCGFELELFKVLYYKYNSTQYNYGEEDW